nr:hypothetical protein [Trichormus sp. ATA11-4-KO1]
RCCGDDSFRVAERQNSSMPGLLLLENPPESLWGVFFFATFTTVYNICHFERLDSPKVTNEG